MKKFAEIYGNIIFTLTVIVILGASIFSVPKLFGIQPYVVLSSSMEPTIPTGSVLFTNTKDTDVEVGDIVTYRITMEKDSALVTHRIIGDDNNSYITKGDANDAEDFIPLTQEQIVGTYMTHIPQVGFLVSKLTKKIIIISIGWIFLLNLFSMIFNHLADKDEKDEAE